MLVDLPSDWMQEVGEELDKPYFQKLSEFVDSERRVAKVFPPEDLVFNAMKTTLFRQVRVLLLGQDPYHDDGQAQGLCFSVPPGVPKPPSLVNIFKELKSDLGCPTPSHGCLVSWANQGVLLLNAVLTVRAHQANSHKNKGWEQFTDSAIRALNASQTPIVFVLWGGYAGKKAALIDTSRHAIVQSAHPSPLSAHNGFFGSKPFSKVNAHLAQFGRAEIDWQID